MSNKYLEKIAGFSITRGMSILTGSAKSKAMNRARVLDDLLAEAKASNSTVESMRPLLHNTAQREAELHTRALIGTGAGVVGVAGAGAYATHRYINKQQALADQERNEFLYGK